MRTIIAAIALTLLALTTAVAAERVPVVRATLTLAGRPILCEYIFGTNGVVYCNAMFRDTFQKAGDSLGTWQIDDNQNVVIQWYNRTNICLPQSREVLSVDLASNPPKLQIVDHADKNQLNAVTGCEIESLGGIPGENATTWLAAVIPAIDSTHLSLINPLQNLSTLQRREMMKRLDEVETEYRENQERVSKIKSNPLSNVLFRVPSDARSKPAGK